MHNKSKEMVANGNPYSLLIHCREWNKKNFLARAIMDKKMKVSLWLFIFKEYLEATEILAVVLICHCIERQSCQYAVCRNKNINVWFFGGKKHR